MNKKIITIDGGAGTGKTTVGKNVAKALNLDFISTGKIFRVLAYQFKNNVKDIFGNLIKIEYVMKKLINTEQYKLDRFVPIEKITFLSNGNYQIGNEIITDKQLNSEEIAHLSSKLSEIKEIRELYEKIIHNIINNSQKGIVMDGRDCGTVICPETKYKFFLECSPEAAAEHRMKDYMNQNITKEEIINKIKERNEENKNRKLSPLIPAKDAIVIDTSDLDVEQVINKVLENIKKIDEKIVK